MFTFLTKRSAAKKAAKAQQAALAAKKQAEVLRKEQNDQVCFAMHVSQGLYQDTSATWTSLASVEKQAIQLPQHLIQTLQEDSDTIVEIVVQQCYPQVKLLLKYGGAGTNFGWDQAQTVVNLPIESLAEETQYCSAIDVIASCLGTSDFVEVIGSIVSDVEDSYSETDAFPTSRCSMCI